MVEGTPQAKSPNVEARKPSKGERAFDWLVYGGIAGVGTFFLTVPLAYAMKYKGGNAWLTKQLGKVGMQEGGTMNTALTTTALMHGGNVMAVPVYIAEVNREQIVDKLNYVMGDKTPISEIEPKPKQTVLSVLTSRLVAWGVVFSGLFSATIVFPKSMETFENEFGKGFAKWFSKGRYKEGASHDLTFTQLVKQEQSLINQMDDLETKLVKGKELKSALNPLKETLEKVQLGTKEQKGLQAFETRTFRLGKIGALDVFATITAATLFYMGNLFFGRMFNEKKGESTPEAPKRKIPIQNPTLPRADSAVETALPGKFAERIAHEKEQIATQEKMHAV